MVETLNLHDDGEGYVTLEQPKPQQTSPVKSNASTSFQMDEKNLAQQQQMPMDSTPLQDIMGDEQNLANGGVMMEAPVMQQQPRIQNLQGVQAPPQAQMGMGQMMPQQQPEVKPESKNPLNLTDDQMVALLVAACTAVAISKPVQDKLVTSVPKLLTENGTRSMVGLGATGLVAAALFYFSKSYVVKA